MNDQIAEDVRRIRLILDWWIIFSLIALAVRGLGWMLLNVGAVAQKKAKKA